MIKCQNINLSFADKNVFSSFNLIVEKGEHVCLNGPSGSGKSSLLKLLQGYILVDSGDIYINEIALNESTVQEIRSSIIYIPQNIHLPVDNGLELIRLMNLSKKLDKSEELLMQLGLEKEYLDKDFSEISGGQKQRIVLSICLSMDRSIILMDEPTSSLDDEAIQLLIKLLKTLNKKVIVSASHNQQWLNSVDKTIHI